MPTGHNDPADVALEAVVADDPTPDPAALLPTASGTGNSTGTTTLHVTSVTNKIGLNWTITGSGVPIPTTIIRQVSGPPGGAGDYITSGPTTLTNIPLTFKPAPSLAFFPAFAPIVPPPPIGEGGGPPPVFPPPTPPPIGDVPDGILVGPVVAPAPVPPSVPGFVQPRFTPPGTAILPTAVSWFPKFTTTFPVPTIVFTNLFMMGSDIPPSTPSTENIHLNDWGLYVPPGAPTEPGDDGRFPRPTLPDTLLEDDPSADARQWLLDNPDDPRAPQVREQLGM